jgi:hypothetical protein
MLTAAAAAVIGSNGFGAKLPPVAVAIERAVAQLDASAAAVAAAPADHRIRVQRDPDDDTRRWVCTCGKRGLWAMFNDVTIGARTHLSEAC